MSQRPARPVVRPSRPWAFPEPEEHLLPGGMRLLTVDLPGQHVLSLRVAVPLPVSSETPGTEGSTLLMARCLDEGTDRHDSEQLATLLERHGIAWGAGAGERGVHLGLEVTARHLSVALDLVAECLSAPTFPAPEVARLVRHRLADIAHDEADPGSRASMELLRTYWHPDDRPSRPLGGTRESVQAIGPDVLAERHTRLGASGSTVVLVGDLSPVGDPVALVAGAFGGWGQAAPAPSAPVPGRRAADAGRAVLVSRPGLAQTELHLWRPGPDRRTPHGWGTFQALAMLLGGSPHARIDRVLREEKGWTYGVRAGFRPRSVGGITVVGGSVRSEATVDAVAELLRILDTPGDELTDEEVRASADFLAMTAPGRYATADAVADELVSMSTEGLPPSTVTTTLAELRTLGRDRVAAAWDEVRSGAGWTLVAVGDPGYADGLGELGLGPVSVVG